MRAFHTVLNSWRAISASPIPTRRRTPSLSSEGSTPGSTRAVSPLTREVSRLVGLLVFCSWNPEVHPVLGETVACATISPHLHTLSYVYNCSVTHYAHYSSSFTPTLGMLITEFVMSWRFSSVQSLQSLLFCCLLLAHITDKECCHFSMITTSDCRDWGCHISPCPLHVGPSV